MIKEISEDYYQKFIKGNGAFATRFFTQTYEGYLRHAVSERMKQQKSVMDRIVEKIIIEDLKEMILDNVKECQKNWAVKDTDCDADFKRYSPAVPIDAGIVSTLKRVYPQYYKQCEVAAADYLKEVEKLPKEEQEKIKSKLSKNEAEIRVTIENEFHKMRVKQGKGLFVPYWDFMNIINYVVATETTVSLTQWAR